ncbi:hypothetical protein BGX38DRAFT_908605 [Terfezia claveryi]|nr:hypothetical protein BGX38DRAFT_908605 [Terfezia claveryi]
MEDDDDESLYGPSITDTPTTAPSNTTALTCPAPAVASPPAAPNAPSAHTSTTVPGLGASEPGDGSVSLPDSSGDVKMVDGEPEELEEGEEEEEEEEVEEEEEEEDDSDIEFVIERTDGSRPEPPPQPSRYNQVRMAPPRGPVTDSKTTPNRTDTPNPPQDPPPPNPNPPHKPPPVPPRKPLTNSTPLPPPPNST